MYAKQFLNKISDNKKKNANAIIKDSTKDMAIGAVVGAGVGLLIGIAKRKSLLMSTFIGSVLGAGISKFINKQ